MQFYLFIIGAITFGGLVGTAYLKGRSDCQEIARAERLYDEKKVLEDIIVSLSITAEKHAQREQIDSALIDELRRQVDEIPDNDGSCLPADSALRLRGIQ